MMKYSKRFFSTLFVVMLVVSCVAFPVSASNSSVETIHFEDGSYLLLEVVSNPAGARSTCAGEKTASYYNGNNDLAWVVTVSGSFYYNGTAAVATSASYSYQIYDTVWTFKGGNAYCSGNQAIAECSFSGLLMNRSTTVVLSCSPTGVLS